MQSAIGSDNTETEKATNQAIAPAPPPPAGAQPASTSQQAAAAQALLSRACRRHPRDDRGSLRHRRRAAARAQSRDRPAAAHRAAAHSRQVDEGRRLMLRTPPLARCVDTCQGDRHERVSERPHLDGAGLQLAWPPWDLEIPRRAPERKDALDAVPRSAPTQTKKRVGRRSKPPRVPTCTSSERSTPLTRLGLVGCHGLHSGSYSLTDVFRRLGPLAVTAALVLPRAGSAAAGPPPPVTARGGSRRQRQDRRRPLRAQRGSAPRNGEHHQADDRDRHAGAPTSDGHRSPSGSRPVRSGGRPIYLRSGEQPARSRSAGGRADPERERCCVRAGRRGRRRERVAVRRAHERRGAGSGASTTPISRARTGWTRRGTTRRPRTRSGSRARR